MTVELLIRVIVVNPARREEEPCDGVLPDWASGFAPGRPLGRCIDRDHNRRVLAGTRVNRKES